MHRLPNQANRLLKQAEDLSMQQTDAKCLQTFRLSIWTCDLWNKWMRKGEWWTTGCLMLCEMTTRHCKILQLAIAGWHWPNISCPDNSSHHVWNFYRSFSLPPTITDWRPVSRLSLHQPKRKENNLFCCWTAPDFLAQIDVSISFDFLLLELLCWVYSTGGPRANSGPQMKSDWPTNHHLKMYK